MLEARDASIGCKSSGRSVGSMLLNILAPLHTSYVLACSAERRKAIARSLCTCKFAPQAHGSGFWPDGARAAVAVAELLHLPRA